MADAASKGCYYADDANDRLRAMVAERVGLTPDHAVIGNGSQEVLSAAALEWSRHGPIVIPELMFDEPLQVAKRHGAEFIRVPLRSDMGVDLDAMAAAAVASKASMVYLCNPNNPTAMLVDSDALRQLSARLPAQMTLLVDEAYNELTDRPRENSVIDLVAAGRNVIVSRTFSKIYGLAGLRIGYILSTPDECRAGQQQHHDDRPRHQHAGRRDRVAQRRGIHDLFEEPHPRGPPNHPRCDPSARPRNIADAGQFRLCEGARCRRCSKRRMAERGIIIRGAYGKWNQWSRVSTGKIEDVRRYAAALPEVARA